MAGIQHLASLLDDHAHQPSSEVYQSSLMSYFSAQESQVRPLLIVQPRSTADVASIIKTLNGASETQNIPIAVRSGGHACAAGMANAQDGLTIDLRLISAIDVSQDRQLATIGTGATWGTVYRTLEPLSLCVPGGRHSFVGVGGLTLGGGLSFFSGRAGLVSDNVVEYEIVLASGNVVKANSEENNDLFDALKAGCNNFGVVTRFTFRTFSQGRIWGGTRIYPIDTKGAQIQAFYEYADSPDLDPAASLIQSFGMSAEKGSGFVNNFFNSNPEANPPCFKDFLSIQPVYVDTVRELTLTGLTKEQDAFNDDGLGQVIISTTTWLDLQLLHNSYDLWQASSESVKDIPGIRWSFTFQIITPATITGSPFLQRVLGSDARLGKSIVIHQLSGTWSRVEDSARAEAAALRLVVDVDRTAAEAGKTTGYKYLNYADPRQDVYGEGTAEKEFLRKVSRKYDPAGFFQTRVVGGHKLF